MTGIYEQGLLAIENVRVFRSESLFLSRTSLGKTRKGIRSSICIFLATLDSEIESRKFLGPSNLPQTQVFCIYELAEIVRVSENKNFKFAAVFVVMPSLEVLNYAQEFLVVSFVLSFYRNHFPKKQGDMILLPQIGS